MSKLQSIITTVPEHLSALTINADSNRTEYDFRVKYGDDKKKPFQEIKMEFYHSYTNGYILAVTAYKTTENFSNDFANILDKLSKTIQIDYYREISSINQKKFKVENIKEITILPIYFYEFITREFAKLNS